MLALDVQQPERDERQPREQSRVREAREQRRVLAERRAPAAGGRPQGGTRVIVRRPHLLLPQELAHTRRLEALERARAQLVVVERPHRDRVVVEGARERPRERLHIGARGAAGTGEVAHVPHPLGSASAGSPAALPRAKASASSS